MNKCLQRAHVPEWMAIGRITLMQKDPKQRNRPKQLQTHNLPTNDMENTNSSNEGRNLLLANKPRFVFHEEQEGCCKGSKGTESLYIDQHILNERKTRRKNVAMA